MNNLIKDKGKVRRCTSNIAKMSWYQYGWYFGFRDFLVVIKRIFTEGMLEFLCAAFRLIVAIFWIIFCPVTLPIAWMRAVINAKKEMDTYNRTGEL